MSLKDIAAIAGKPGLYKILKPTRSGVIVETIGEKKSKMVISASQRISVLKEISVYVTTAEDSISLHQIFQSIKEQDDAESIQVSDQEALKAFFAKVLPEYDKDRVYVSDIKKIVNWYRTLNTYYPEAFEEEEENEEEQQEEQKVEESTK